MKKLRLTLDDLRINTFETLPAKREKGTVFAEQYGTYGDYQTCGYSCAPTCYGSCPPYTCDFSCPVENTCYMGAC
jgi:hypothetical protein